MQDTELLEINSSLFLDLMYRKLMKVEYYFMSNITECIADMYMALCLM